MPKVQTVGELRDYLNTLDKEYLDKEVTVRVQDPDEGNDQCGALFMAGIEVSIYECDQPELPL